MSRTENRYEIVRERLMGLRGEEELRKLCAELNYKPCKTELSTRRWQSAAAQKLLEEKHIAAPVLLTSAGHDGDFRIIYTRQHSNDLRLVYERQVVTQLLQEHPYALFIFSNDEQDRWHFLNVKYHQHSQRHSRVFRRIAVGGHDRLHTAAKRLAMLDLEAFTQKSDSLSPLDIQKVHDEAFDVEAVTAKFYHGDKSIGEPGYKDIFTALQNDLLKQTRHADQSWAHDYALQFLNRTMFLYFVQRKHWLGEDAEFLRSFWQSYRNARRPKDSFFADWLSVLFFEAFNRPPRTRKIDHKFFSPKIREALNSTPYLNGGLFKRNALDTPEGLQFLITDEAFKGVFSFLERYEFTITQESPIDQDIAVDAQMIGSVYETLVNTSTQQDKQGEAGVYYTPRFEIDLMCRIALVDQLANHLGHSYKPILYETVFAVEEEEKALAGQKLRAAKLWPDLSACLRELTVLDPACGSGSFLVGMLYVLDDLQKRANDQLDKREERFERKKRIIAENLYGVEVMKWATQIAEWRLWLNLMVDAPDDLKASNEALLPHFACKVRCGDSLVQEVGGVNLGHRRRSRELPVELRDQIRDLQQQKRDFYFNRSNLSFANLVRQENRLYLHLLAKRGETIEKEIKRLQQRITGPTGRQLRLDGTAETSSHQMELQAVDWQTQIKALQAELADIQQRSHALNHRDAKQRASNGFFVWDIAFPEIFADEKGGFDIVVGNPPYVRQEKIANLRAETGESLKEKNVEYKAKLARSVHQLYPDFFGYKPGKGTASRKIDGKSDLYIFFYFHALSLLNPRGSFCFITSNSWLDVGYGAELQEFLLKHCHVKMIIDNQVQRTFGQADVNTIIALFSAPDESREWGLEQTARFVMFKQPFENVVSADTFQQIESITERQATSDFRVHPAQQRALLVAGSEDASTGPLIKVERYLGDKWGGKYLRMPDFLWRFIDEERLVPLEKLCSLEYGNKSGLVDFFVLSQKLIVESKIEKRFLKKIITSTEEITGLLVLSEHVKKSVFVCPLTLKELRKQGFTGAEAYVQWGSEQFTRKKASHTIGGVPWPKVQSVKSNHPEWHCLQLREVGDFIVPRLIRERFFFASNPSQLLDTDMFFHGRFLHRKDAELGVALINSTVVYLLLEIFGRHNIEGRFNVYGPELRPLPVPHLDLFDRATSERILKHFNILAQRRVLKILKEVKQPDRQAFDKIIFDTLGFTQGEREQVYKTLENLVKTRLKKAESLKPKNRHENDDEEEM